jgi:hypothetical protein
MKDNAVFPVVKDVSVGQIVSCKKKQGCGGITDYCRYPYPGPISSKQEYKRAEDYKK